MNSAANRQYRAVSTAITPATTMSKARLVRPCKPLRDADDISSSGWYPIAVVCTRLKSMPERPGSTYSVRPRARASADRSLRSHRSSSAEQSTTTSMSSDDSTSRDWSYVPLPEIGHPGRRSLLLWLR